MLTILKEAAALYTVKYLSPSVLQTGRRFVVCDAGGGTVDLITYEVAQVQPLQMREVTEGTGGKCGSSMLNMRFRRYLKQIHGDKYWTDERLVVALSEFEAVCMCQNILISIISLTYFSSKGIFSQRVSHLH